MAVVICCCSCSTERQIIDFTSGEWSKCISYCMIDSNMNCNCRITTVSSAISVSMTVVICSCSRSTERQIITFTSCDSSKCISYSMIDDNVNCNSRVTTVGSTCSVSMTVIICSSSCSTERQI